LAELQMQTIYDVSDTLFYAPPNVFLDVYDSASAKFKLVPSIFGITQSSTGGYLLTGMEKFYTSGSLNQTFFNVNDPFGNRVHQWRFNLTRYIQNVVSDRITAYNMRLYAPAATSLPLGDLNPVVADNIAVPNPQSDFFG